MASVVDSLVALAIGVLDAIVFVVAFVVLSFLTGNVVPWSIRAVVVVTAVGALVGVPVTVYSTVRFRRDGQMFPSVRGFVRLWTRWVPWWF